MMDLGTTAGVAGQAADFAVSLGLSAELAVSAAAIFAVADIFGGLVAGWVADRFRASRLITALPLGSAVAAALITLAGGAT